MNSEALFSAIGNLSDDLVADASITTSKPEKTVFHFHWKSLVAACLVIIMLAMPVSAEMINGYVSNLLAPLYGFAQTEIVDKIGQPIGASTIVGDYELTADAVIGDKYSVAIIYSLSRVDGEPLEEGLNFETYSNSLKTNGGASYSQILSEDKTKLSIIEKWIGTNNLFLNRNVSISFSNLVVTSEDGNGTSIVQEGSWNLQYCLRYEDTSSQIEAKEISVVDTSEITYQIDKIFISPVGIHIDMTIPNPHVDGINTDRQFKDFSVSVVLKTGEAIPVESRLLGYNGNLEDEYLDGDYSALFETPINISDISELIICDTSILIDDML